MTDSEDNSMILIGGEVDGEPTEKVGRYDKTGKVAHLPDLIYPRMSHGCAGYKNSMGKLVSPLLSPLSPALTVDIARLSSLLEEFGQETTSPQTRLNFCWTLTQPPPGRWRSLCPGYTTS